MAEMRAAPRNRFVGSVADYLAKLRALGDKAEVPVLGGLGSLVLGQSPEELENWAYGDAPFTVPEESNLPQESGEGRALQVVDVLGATPLLGAPLKLAQVAARPLARPQVVGALRRAASSLGVPSSGATTSNVIKPKGGQWLTGSVEDALRPLRQWDVRNDRVPLNPRDSAEEAERLSLPGRAINEWIDKQLTRYVKTDMATPDDPIRALAERGVLHVDPAELNYRPETYGKYMSEGQTLMAQSPAAKQWEGVTDLSIMPGTAGGILRKTDNQAKDWLEKNPWLAKVPPETSVYHGGIDPRDLGFKHLIDELRNATNPDSGLPPELLLKYSSLPKVSVPQAVQRVHDINQWRAAQMAEANKALAMNPATHLLKEYPESGMRWVELKKPDSSGKSISRELSDEELMEQDFDAAYEAGLEIGGPGYDDFLAQRRAAGKGYEQTEDESIAALRKALKYEGDTMGHCVGGYCDDVASGKSRIFSLRDAKGQPHVTIETRPPYRDRGWRGARPEDEEAALQAYQDAARVDPAVNAMTPAEFWRQQSGIEEPDAPPWNILQIKGKQNRAPNPEYLAAVQDFVRTQGPWSDVGDLHNTGLVPRRALPAAEQSLLPEAGDYLTMGEIKKLREGRQWTPIDDRPEFAAGGAVVADDTFVPDFMEDSQAREDFQQNARNIAGAATDPQFYKDVAGNAARAAFDDGEFNAMINGLLQELGL